MNRAAIVLSAALLALAPAAAQPQSLPDGVSVDRDVRYGWVSGLALLMDVYVPADASGHAVIYVRGSGCHTGLGYDAFSHTVQAAGDQGFIVS